MSNRYEIREQIGKGGLGAVYKAFDTQLQREVAIKRVLSPDQATDEEVKEAANKLIAEAQTLSCLNHPNIVTVFDVGQDEQGGFVVMELLNGETLDETISRGVLTKDDFTEVVYQTMEALISAQASNVIHRDIKPTNIMVIWQASGKFQLKILDFGLAKFSKTPSVQTMDQEESVLGSIFFMAPEQFERGELDSRTDIYQMGCVYYNALTGQYPFNGETAPQVMNAHLQHKVIPLEQIRPDLPPATCQWVMWLINRDINHRPEDAHDALKRWPKNPDAAGDVPVAKALPVEDTPTVSTGEIKIVRASQQAAAPPSLIVSGGSSTDGARTGRLLTGSTTGQIRSGRSTGPVRGGRTTARKSSSTAGGNRIKLIILGVLGALVVVFIGMRMAEKAETREKVDRIIQLSSADNPDGNAADVVTAVEMLRDPGTSPSLRSDATKVLETIEGPGIDDAILAQLKSAETTALQLPLSRILSERGHAPAVPEIIAAFRGASSDEQKVQFLDAVRAIAGMDKIDELLDALQGDHSLSVRRIFEDTVLAVLRKADNPDPVIDKMLSRVSKTSGSERRSLFRILGVMGGDKVRTRLTSVYNRENDIDYQRDAMTAYRSWRDRSVIPEVETIISGTSDAALRSAAERAFTHLVTLPSTEPVEEVIASWNRAFELVNNPNDIRRLTSAAIEYPSPESLAAIKKWAEHGTHGNLVRPSITTLERTINSVPEVDPGQDLKGNRARILGDNRSGAAINSFLESLTSWVSPETWFTWNFKVKEAGEYGIEVDQASLSEESSQFEVILSEKILKGESKQTDSLEEFKTVSVEGSVSLEADKIYTLTLRAGEKVQPRMMDIGAIRLVRQ